MKGNFKKKLQVLKPKERLEIKLIMTYLIFIILKKKQM